MIHKFQAKKKKKNNFSLSFNIKVRNNILNKGWKYNKFDRTSMHIFFPVALMKTSFI